MNALDMAIRPVAADAGRKPLIQAENVSKIYQMGEQTVSALDEVSLTIGQGEFVAIMGPSGSGKSTMMNLIGALDVPSAGHADECFIHLGVVEFGADAEEGIHGALAIGCHQDEGTRGRRAARHRLLPESDAGGANVVAEDAAELVTGDLADETCPSADGGEAHGGICGRPAGDFDGGSHVGVDRLDRLGVHEAHVALGRSVLRKECVVASADDIDNGVADGDDIQAGGAHWGGSFD